MLQPLPLAPRRGSDVRVRLRRYAAGTALRTPGSDRSTRFPKRLSRPPRLSRATPARPHRLPVHERNAGVIEPGRLADLVVLDRNPLTEDLDTVQVVRTIVDGKTVFDTGAAA